MGHWKRTSPAGVMLGAAIAAATTLGCPASRPVERDWADIPLAGAHEPDRATLVELMADPDAYRDRTVRMSLRVVASHRDARGVWLRVVAPGAPPGAQYVKLLIPKSDDGREYLETAGREIDLALTVVRPVATMAYETAFEVRPIAYVTRFSSSSRGGEDAVEVRRRIGGEP